MEVVIEDIGQQEEINMLKAQMGKILEVLQSLEARVNKINTPQSTSDHPRIYTKAKSEYVQNTVSTDTPANGPNLVPVVQVKRPETLEKWQFLKERLRAIEGASKY
ncbi:hypothetical protein CR513_30715, partial [Mucuna pruriens]